MMYGQYCRMESKAGGVVATDVQFIKACLSVVKKRSRYSREYREARHQWLREGLAMLHNAQSEYNSIYR